MTRPRGTQRPRSRARSSTSGRAPGVHATPSSRRARGRRRSRSRWRATAGSASHVVLDERSAAFRALGIGLATGRPAIVLLHVGDRGRQLPSGGDRSAHARVPLHRLHRRPAARAAATPARGRRSTRRSSTATPCAGSAIPARPTTSAGAGATWRALAGRAVAGAVGPPAGPGAPQPAVPRAAACRPARRWSTRPVAPTAQPWTRRRSHATRAPTPRSSSVSPRSCARHPSGLLVAGWGAACRRRPRRASPPRRAGRSSPTRSRNSARARTRSRRTKRCCARRAFATRVPTRSSCCASVRRSRARSPTRGSTPTSPQVVVDPDGAWLDPHRAATERIGRRRAAARRGRARARRAAGATVAVARRLAARPSGGPRRDRRACSTHADARVRRRASRATSRPRCPTARRWWSRRACRCARSSGAWRRATGCACCANRGANGIDGFVSTVLGVARRRPAPTVGLCGDLCFLHDTNGLLGAREPARDVRGHRQRRRRHLLVPAARTELPEFEQLFGTPHGLDLVAVARAHGVHRRRASTRSTDLPAALAARRPRACSSFPSTARRASPATARCWIGRAPDSRHIRGRELRTNRTLAPAASAWASLACVSAHSASGSEPATMPAPA